MSITTIQGANDGLKRVKEFAKPSAGTMIANHPHSFFYTVGMPNAGATPTPGIGGEVLTAPVTGQIPFENPTSGNTYLARLQASGSVAGTLLLCDRLWQNSGIDLTSTAEQTFTSSAQIPARDAVGTNAGIGVYAALEFSAAAGAAAPTYTLKYTNSAGTTGQTNTPIIAAVN
jgi:hypothetical protein